MTPTQYNTLIDFYDNTLFGGSQPFDWIHPLTGAAASVKFDLSVEDDIQIAGIITPNKWRIEMAFEILP